MISSSSRSADVVEDHGAVDHLGREVAQRGELVGGQAGRAQVGVRDRGQGAGVQGAVDQGAHPAVDGRRRRPGELLVDDGAHQRAEVAVRVARAVGDRPHAGDQRVHHRVGGGDGGDRAGQRRAPGRRAARRGRGGRVAGLRQVHARAAHGHALGAQQLGLALAHGDAAVGAHHPVPRHVGAGGGEDAPHQARRRRIHVRVRAHEPARDGAHPVQNALGAVVRAHPCGAVTARTRGPAGAGRGRSRAAGR